LNSKIFANKIAKLIFEKKGHDVKAIDLREITTVTDFFLICSADSDTQVKAIADHVEKSLRDDGIKIWHKEGYNALQWVLLDYVDVVIHVFHTEARNFYNLEKLWGDAKITSYEDKPPKPKTVTRKKTKTS
jgi:ribosome-associated protein